MSQSWQKLNTAPLLPTASEPTRGRSDHIIGKIWWIPRVSQSPDLHISSDAPISSNEEHIDIHRQNVSFTSKSLEKGWCNVLFSMCFPLIGFEKESVSPERVWPVFSICDLEVPSAGHSPAPAVAEKHGTRELDAFSTPVCLPQTLRTLVLQGALGHPLPWEWRCSDDLPGSRGKTKGNLPVFFWKQLYWPHFAE